MEEKPLTPLARKKYEKPVVRSSELFERRALTCGIQQSAPRQAGCGTFHQSV